MSKNSLNVPADAVELSMNDLEDVNGAWMNGGFGGGCGCFIAFEQNFKFHVEHCFKFVSFGGCGSCFSCESCGSCGSCWSCGSCGSCWSCGSCGFGFGNGGFN